MEPGVGVDGYLVGSFVLVPTAGDEWDEYLVCGRTPSSDRRIALTTSSASPHGFIWIELVFPVISMRVMIGIDAHRHPALVPVVNVNFISYICVGNHLWCPTMGEIGGMMQQGTAMGHQLSTQRRIAAAAGQPMPTPLPVAPAGAVAPVGVAAGQAGAGVGGPAWPQGLDAVQGVGDGGPVLPVLAPAGAPGNLGFHPPAPEAQALAQQMLSLQGAMDDLRVAAKREKRKKSSSKKNK